MEQLTDESKMPFGKYKDKRMIDVPAPYLLWLFNEGCDHEGVRQYIHNNLQVLKAEAGRVKR